MASVRIVVAPDRNAQNAPHEVSFLLLPDTQLVD